MSLFAQTTKLTATPGNVDVLLAKFEAAVEIQKDNAGCEVMIAAKASIESSVVYLIEVWSSEEEWDGARSSPAIAKWAREMPPLVFAPPESTCLDSAIGKGLSRRWQTGGLVDPVAPAKANQHPPGAAQLSTSIWRLVGPGDPQPIRACSLKGAGITNWNDVLALTTSPVFANRRSGPGWPVRPVCSAR